MKQAGNWVRAIALCTLAAGAVITPSAALQAKGYAALDKLPDWSGVWQPDWSGLFKGRAAAKPPYTPETAKMMADFEAAKKEGENLQSQDANCVPPGMPRVMRMPYPIEFIYSPGRVTIATEAYMQIRRIYTDGRPLQDDPDPAFNGNSIGHWDGDTLVVETNGLNTNTTIMPGLHPTAKTRITERMHITKPNVMTIEQTITDPTLFTRPWTTSQDYKREKGWTIREYICEENNRDASDPFGRPSMDIGEPKDN